MVRKKRKPEPPEAAASDNEFFADFRDLLDDDEHKDTLLQIEHDGSSLRAHKAILTARSDYFKSAFRKNTFDESKTSILKISSNFKASTVGMMLEFIYTNRLQHIYDMPIDTLLEVLHCAEFHGLRDLKKIAEHSLISKIDVTNVAKLYCATDDFKAVRLAEKCIQFIMEHIREVTSDGNFVLEMRNYPNLCIPVLQAAAKLIPEGPSQKKPRLSSAISGGEAHQSHHESAGGSSHGRREVSSSPVPDS